MFRGLQVVSGRFKPEVRGAEWFLVKAPFGLCLFESGHYDSLGEIKEMMGDDYLAGRRAVGLAFRLAVPGTISATPWRWVDGSWSVRLARSGRSV